jgi:hypothetical protein
MRNRFSVHGGAGSLEVNVGRERYISGQALRYKIEGIRCGPDVGASSGDSIFSSGVVVFGGTLPRSVADIALPIEQAGRGRRKRAHNDRRNQMSTIHS